MGLFKDYVTSKIDYTLNSIAHVFIDGREYQVDFSKNVWFDLCEDAVGVIPPIHPVSAYTHPVFDPKGNLIGGIQECVAYLALEMASMPTIRLAVVDIVNLKSKLPNKVYAVNRSNSMCEIATYPAKKNGKLLNRKGFYRRRAFNNNLSVFIDNLDFYVTDIKTRRSYKMFFNFPDRFYKIEELLRTPDVNHNKLISDFSGGEIV